ncbi:MAG: VWA domain-containing protein [Candidatus Cloacimonetes bacterium]|nr:VWA domain-containing protein [Candidatus Cloacimonadota bacterium]
MKEGLKELVFILDRSGSMAGLEDSTIKGYNKIFAENKDGYDCMVTTVLFNDKYEVLHDRVDIKSIKKLTKKEYVVGGQTALLDAVGKAINHIGQALSDTPEHERPEKVLFIITTDGQENASNEFNYDAIRAMITHQREKYSWEFIFLGANIEADDVADQMGIRYRSNYIADTDGTNMQYKKTKDVVCCFMASYGSHDTEYLKKVDATLNELNQDYLNRKAKPSAPVEKKATKPKEKKPAEPKEKKPAKPKK